MSNLEKRKQPEFTRFMKTIQTGPLVEQFEARRRVEAYCQTLMDAGVARWALNGDGDTEHHLESGEAYLFGEIGITRLDDWTNDTTPDIESTRRRS